MEKVLKMFVAASTFKGAILKEATGRKSGHAGCRFATVFTLLYGKRVRFPLPRTIREAGRAVDCSGPENRRGSRLRGFKSPASRQHE